ncbi:GNAT family N-acetyltransferase [Mucilaginibacter sp. 14171R-50]|uniref:GNAT family N-acetyltransferase n=1 Tax=Mucilaginibacter sp. 14171R-50 TaxID=2703789 RepID=UPI00138B6195|nr:GNAT family N-acetyltransferase [Mucilaginibacter sp. 14171R-50]QHS57063.1 GNAT family N-acetyltransferase [Mucilaginibacter sp. 14171R-50]
MPVPVEIKRVTIDDIEVLLTLGRKTFFDAFLHRNSREDMDAYASTAFTTSRFEEELNNPDSEFYFAVVDNAIAGYIKLNYPNAQTDLQDPNALEVERIYVLQQYQGQQIGKHLLNFAIQTATDKQFKYVWLGVWEHNTKAIEFYKSKGFTQFGSHPFVLGNDEQTDILMKRPL